MNGIGTGGININVSGINLGLIDEETRTKVAQLIEQNARQNALEKCDRRIYQCKDGRWRVSWVDQTTGKRIQKASIDRKVVEDFLISYDGMIVNPTIEDCLEEFIKRKRLLNPASCEKYRQIFNRNLSEVKDRPIEQFGYKDLEELARGIMEKGIKKKAFNDFATVVNGVFETASDIMELNVIEPRRSMQKIRRVLGNNFTDSVIEVNKVDEKESALTRDELQQIINECLKANTSVDLGIILVCYSGLREGELAVLRKSNISEDRRMIYVKHSESRANNIYSEGLPKWKKQRVVYLPDIAIPIVEALIEMSDPDSDFLFSDKDYSYKWFRAKRFSDRLLRVQKNLGFEELRSPHDVRRTYDSLLEGTGAPLPFRYSMMGHSTKGIDSHYLRDITTDQEKIDFLNKAFPGNEIVPGVAEGT